MLPDVPADRPPPSSIEEPQAAGGTATPSGISPPVEPREVTLIESMPDLAADLVPLPPQLTNESTREIEDAIGAAWSPNTRRAYGAALAKLTDWVHVHHPESLRGEHNDPLRRVLPLHPATLSDFLARVEVPGRGRDGVWRTRPASSGTLALYLSAIRAAHRELDLPDPTVNRHFAKLWRGLRKQRGTRQLPKAAARWSLLKLMLDAVDQAGVAGIRPWVSRTRLQSQVRPEEGSRRADLNPSNPSAINALALGVERGTTWDYGLGSDIHVLRGTLRLDDAPLRRAALDAAFGVARAIGELQRRMTVGARDPRLADRKRVERVALLPAFAPLGVDPESWGELAIAHDESARPLRRGRAWAALKRHEEADPDGFCRLMAAAEGHDDTVENLFVRATSIEDALAFAAASREIWRRFFGSPHPLPSLPIHAAWLPLSRVYDPFQAGTVLARAGLLTVPPTANFKAKEIRRSLQQAADRSQRFWVSLVGEEEAVAVATEFVGIIGDLVLAEREAANRLPERAGSLWRRRRRPAWPLPPTEEP